MMLSLYTNKIFYLLWLLPGYLFWLLLKKIWSFMNTDYTTPETEEEISIFNKNKRKNKKKEEKE